jgi:hypothetical protein
MKQRERRWSFVSGARGPGALRASGACMALVIGAGLGSGCDLITEKITQKVTEKAVEHTIEKETGGDVQVNEGSLSFKNDKGTVELGAKAKVPDSWPKDVPMYPGAKVTAAMSNDTQQVVALETADSPEQAVAFYKDKLSAMKQEAAMSTPQQEMLVYKDPSERLVQLSVGKEQGGTGPNTTIALIIAQPKKKKADPQ